MVKSVKGAFRPFFNEPKHIAPLAILRIAFGSIMLISTVRFIVKGWVSAFYIKPPFHFTFYGFDWVKPLGAMGMYFLFGTLVVATVLIIIGLFYRVAILTFFLGFTYVELIDKTTYLNHYYFISVMAFLMILVPAHRYFSVDVMRKPQLLITQVPRWSIDIFKVQLLLVYFFAGLSKLNYDWLIEAMPLRIWLPANSHLPIIGNLLTNVWVAYVFSWFGALFDLVIGFLLLDARTRKPAYLMIIVFHLATGWLFKIGMFPYIMICVTLIFFSEKTHLQIINWLKRLVLTSHIASTHVLPEHFYRLSIAKQNVVGAVLLLHFTIQLVLPLRFLLYPGNLYWTEEGYRFSWRVMLMEKGGTTFFHIKDPETGKQAEVLNAQYLTDFQEKMMSTQPDMILQFAHFLARVYQQNGVKYPIVTAESYVTLNGSGSRLYIDSTINLANEQETFATKKWIRPFHEKDE